MTATREAVAAWAKVYDRVRHPTDEAEYLALVAFLDDLVDNYNADEEPYASLFALAGGYAHEWEEANEPPIPETTPGETLAFLLEEHGLTQSDLAREGVGDQSTLSKILRADRSVSKALAIRLGKRFHITPAVFL